MEDITLERLQDRFDEVIAQIDDIVARKDIAQAREVMRQIEELVQNDTHVRLDDQEGYDHILHRLLANISGVIEIAETRGINPELDALISEKERIEQEVREITLELDAMRTGDEDPEQDDDEPQIPRITDGKSMLDDGTIDSIIEKIKREISTKESTLRRSTIRESTRTSVTLEITQLRGYLTVLESFRQGKEVDDNNPDVPKDDLNDQINSLNDDIAKLEEELSRLESEVTEDKVIYEGYLKTANVDEPKVLFKSDTGIEFDPNIHEIQPPIDPQMFESEEPSITFHVVEKGQKRVEKQRKELADKKAQRDALIAQKRISSLDADIAKLEEEISRLGPEDEERKSLYKGNAETARAESPEQIFEHETGIKFDPEIHKLDLPGNAKLEDLEEEVAFGFEIVERQSRAERLRKELADKKAQRDALKTLNDDIAKLEEEISRLGPEDEERKSLYKGNAETARAESPEQIFEHETGIKFDPEIHKLDLPGNAKLEDLEEEVAFGFEIVERQSRAERLRKELADKKAQRDALGIEDKPNPELDDQIKSLNDDIAKLEDDLKRPEKLRKEIADKKAQRDALIAQRDGGSKDSGSKDAKSRSGSTESVSKIDIRIRVIEVLIEYYQMRIETTRRRKQSKEATEREVDGYLAKIRELKREWDGLKAARDAKGNGKKSGGTKGNPAKGDNSQRKSELQRRRAELVRRWNEIDAEIKGIAGREGIPGDVYDLGAEAQRIGDHIFKTAAIRRELAERGYTREDFLSFYEQGRARTKARLDEIRAAIDSSVSNLSQIVGDDSGVNLDEQLRDAEDETIKMAVLEKIRQNMISAGMEDELKKSGFDKAITTADQATAFEAFYNAIVSQIEGGLTALHEETTQHRENLRVFDREIQRIRNEQEALKVTSDDSKSVEDEKDLRERQVRATIFGDEELEKEWNERAQRFVGHRAKKAGTYIGSDGEEHKIEYDTIMDYGQYEEDAYFLNLEEYRRNLEMVSRFEASGGDPASIDLTGPEFDDYHSLCETDPDAARQWLERCIAEKKDYVSSFHGFTNEHAVKYATWKTAGSTLQAMLPVKGDLPTTTKLKNAGINVLRFMSIGIPKFTRTNSRGEEVPNALGGALTLAADGLVVGGLAAAAMAGPVGLIPVGAYYAAKGIVTAGNVVASRREYKRHQSEIDSNLPTLGHPSASDRMVARKEYYRDIEGYSRPRAWARAWVDRIFTRKRGRETEEAIASRITAGVHADLDERREVARANAEIAERNQQVREARQVEAIRSQGTYNDLVRDPDKADVDQVAAIAAQNAAVRSYDPDYEGADVNPLSTEPRTGKYVREDGKYEQTQDLKDISTGKASVAAITEDQKYRARMERQDRINRVASIILAGAIKVGVDFARTGFKDTREITVEKPVKKKQPDQTVTVEDKETVEVTKLSNPNQRISDYDNNGLTSDNTYGLDGISNGETPSGRVDAIAIRTGPDTEVSAGPVGTGFSTRHVHTLTDFNFNDHSLIEALEVVSKEDPASWSQYLVRKGLAANTPIEDVAVRAMLDGDIYVQGVGMEGWTKLTGGLTKVLEEHVIGSHTEIIPGKEIVEMVPETITESFFSLEKLARSAAEGLGVGAAFTGLEAVEEAGSPTDRVAEKGNYDERNADASLRSRIAKLAQDEYDRTHSRAAKPTKKKDGKGKDEDGKGIDDDGRDEGDEGEDKDGDERD